MPEELVTKQFGCRDNERYPNGSCRDKSENELPPSHVEQPSAEVGCDTEPGGKAADKDRRGAAVFEPALSIANFLRRDPTCEPSGVESVPARQSADEKRENVARKNPEKAGK